MQQLLLVTFFYSDKLWGTPWAIPQGQGVSFRASFKSLKHMGQLLLVTFFDSMKLVCDGIMHAQIEGQTVVFV